MLITSATVIIYGKTIWDPVQLVGQFKAAGLQPGGDLANGMRGWTQAVPLLKTDAPGDVLMREVWGWSLPVSLAVAAGRVDRERVVHPDVLGAVPLCDLRKAAHTQSISHPIDVIEPRCN